jgi:hypothetical protein
MSSKLITCVAKAIPTVRFSFPALGRTYGLIQQPLRPGNIEEAFTLAADMQASPHMHTNTGRIDVKFIFGQRPSPTT